MKYAPILTVAVFALSLLPGCGKSKIDQCNAFIERANQSQNVINALKLDSDDPKELEQGAAKVESEAKTLAAVELKDEKLVGFRTDYSGSLNSLAKIVHDLATAQKDSKDPSKAKAVEAQSKKLEADADKLGKAESILIDQINVYCTGSK
ncbi:MAG TPA: hypothetical protein VJT73_04045 [Polyangiaceae bacterium]|nr:hypothetical protein [Polyangiaceae bacterium]